MKVFRTLIATAASQRHSEHGHRKIRAILDVAVAFLHADMVDVIYAHPPAEAEPDRSVVWLSRKAHYGTRRAARLWQEFLHNEVFMKAGWDAVVVESEAVSLAGGTVTYLALDRPDIVYSIRRAIQDIAKPKVRTEA